jgi:hypothetical protein
VGSAAELVSLGSSGNEERLISKINQAVGVVGAGPGALLALDSLDECPLTTTALAGLIEEVAAELPDGVRLALACRTAAWLPGVDHVLRQAFPEYAIFDLAPLTVEDIAAYARSAGADEAAFLGALAKANAMALAANPSSLEMLVDQYLAGDLVLPGTQQDLFERSCRRLVAEPNKRRQHPLEPVDVAELVNAAGRLAAFSLLTARPSFALSAEPAPDYLTVEDCAEPRYAAVLGTALFESAGDGRMQFTHQTIAEFLAARYLAGSGVSAIQLGTLLHSRGGLLAPQVQAAAAWLVALDPQRFGGLLDEDPVAFLRSRVELTDPAYRQNLVERLLELAGRYELPDLFVTGLDALAYDGVEDRLRAVLTDSNASLDLQYLAIRIAVSNHLADLANALVDLAVHGRQPVPLRASAGQAALDLADAHTVSRLTVLTQPEYTADDSEDELFSVGLRALLHDGLPPVALLPQLKAPEHSAHIGGYRLLLALELPDRFRSSTLTPDELRTAVAWAADLEATAHPLAEPAEKLCDAILLTGLCHLDSTDVREQVARLIHARLQAGVEILHDRDLKLPDTEDPDRRELLLTLHHELTHPTLTYGLEGTGLVQPTDLAWLLPHATAASTDEQAQRWRPWLSIIYDPARPEDRAALAAVPNESPLYRQAVEPLLQPPPPARRSRPKQPPPPTQEEIHTRLVESLDSGADDAFASLSYYAEFRPGSHRADTALYPRITSLPGWELLLTDEQRLRAVAAARLYLQTATDNGEDLLGTNRFRPNVIAIGRALALLAESDAAPDLDVDRWQFLAPAMIQSLAGSTHHVAVVQAVRWVYQHAPQALLAAAEKQMRGMPEHSGFALHSIAPALTEHAVPWLLTLIDEETLDTGAVLAQLLTLDEPTALDVVATTVAERSSRLGTLAVITISLAGSAGWALLGDALRSDPAVAEQVIGGLADGGQFQSTALDECHVVELWDLTQRLFPPGGDPAVYGTHWVGRREAIGRFRDRLLPELAERGTATAVDCLRNLANTRPDEPWIRQLIARARTALGRADWTPLLPTETSEVLARTLLVVRNDEDLLQVVLDTLAQIQQGLQGATPQATMLWNHGPPCTPKTEDEISDYLAHELTRSVRGTIVNREVQVERMRTSGIGRRVDLLVQAPAPGGSARILRTVIEVKGNWNDEIDNALEDQLVQRYLARSPRATGIFLVAWFDPSHGFKPGPWRNHPIRGNQNELATTLTDRAARATMDSGHAIRAFVLDCSTAIKCRPAS